MNRLFLLLVALLLPAFWIAAAESGTAVIAEFLASNVGGLKDEDGDSSDWIELQNPGAASVDLAGWWLANVEGTLTPWRFPSVTLPAGARLVVFASGKNRVQPGTPLHTDFKLSAAGGYLALGRPNGTSVATEFRYGPQRQNVSLGVARSLANTPLVAVDASARLHVPVDDSDGRDWTGGHEPWADADWLPVRLGVGFDESTEASGLIAYWDFNDASDPDRARDLAGGNHHGTLRSAAFTPPGQGRSEAPDDRAVNLAGTGCVEIADAAAGVFDSATAHDAITLSLWVRGDSAQPAQDSIFWAGSDAGGGGIRSLNAHLPWSDQVIYWDTAGCCDPGLHRISISEGDPNQWRGRWNHYAFVKKGDTKQIWQNGRLLHEGINSADLTVIRSFFIGCVAPGQGGYHGLIDDFAVWDVALDPVAIAALAQAVSPFAVRRLSEWIATDVAAVVRSVNASVYLRVPFTVQRPEDFDILLLRIRYDDGFVAYLNGVEIARRNAPDALGFRAAAAGSRPGAAASAVEEIEVPGITGLLRTGTNVLAFQALNYGTDDPDFLLQPELLGGRSLGQRFFPKPTPGQPNDNGVEGFTDDPQFEPGRGFFTNPIEVRLWTDTPGASLAYTTNGSIPSPSNGVVTPAAQVTVRVAQTTVLRAVAFKDGLASGGVVTHSYIFPASVAAQRRPASVPATWPDGAPADFAIDPRVVSQAQPGYGFSEALVHLPTVSLVAPEADIFGPQGIYANPGGHGDTWEREASLEWVLPDGRRGFQKQVGLSIHGGISRDKGFTPKHGFTLNFRGEYGPATLGESVLPDTPIRDFNRLLLRAGSTDTWPCVEWDTIIDGVKRWYRKDACNLRDQWVRDAQIAMGQPSGHGTYVHLYLNGLYWGLYNLCERPDDDFAALHLGGNADEYDVLADFAEIHGGNADAWNRLMSLSAANLAQNANYQRLQGNRADGTRNPQYEVLLDVDNLIDYMILHIFIGADDWPNHNWWAGRRRGSESTGFKFFAWDQEISINSLVRQHSSWGPIYAEADAANTPTYVYAQCRRNAEFRQRFADRVQKHLFGGGALSVSNNLARWAARTAEVDQAIVAESARWGDYQRPSKPYLREIEWLANDRWMRSTYFPSNQLVALKRFRAANLYPRMEAPELGSPSGVVTPGFLLELRNPNATGELYFTADGSDPRLPGGAVSSAAQSYSGPIPISQRTPLRVRIRDGATWSALVAATYFTPADFAALQLTEIHFNPVSVGAVDGDRFEFLELQNTSTNELELEGLEFTSGVQFIFPPGSRLAPGAFAVLARDAARFAEQFPGVPLQGEYSGGLDNGGEMLTLVHPVGVTVFSFSYHDGSTWPPAADGLGYSLQRMDLARPPGLPSAWAAAPPTPGKPLDSSLADSDADGVPDFWERLFATDPLQADSAADLDGDGRSGLEEYRAGTNPRDAASALRLAAASVAAAADEVELRFEAMADRSYAVQRCDDVAHSTWQSIARIEAASESHSVTLRPVMTGEGSFFRVITPAP